MQICHVDCSLSNGWSVLESKGRPWPHGN
uniref:Uncharacterized protein n=1 Tax=Arundo donax TaxID=35708 RepID=A0A0A9BFD1_ARUDO